MAVDEELADRLRPLLPGAAEKRMFGGVAFLVDGAMAVAASGTGGLLVRVDPAEQDDLLAEPGAEPFVMRGRPMAGWLGVRADAVETDDALAVWVARGAARARSVAADG